MKTVKTSYKFIPAPLSSMGASRLSLDSEYLIAQKMGRFIADFRVAEIDDTFSRKTAHSLGFFDSSVIGFRCQSGVRHWVSDDGPGVCE